MSRRERPESSVRDPDDEANHRLGTLGVVGTPTPSFPP